MKTLLICFALISMVVVQVDVAACSGAMYIHPGVLDPCKRPGRPHLRCHLNLKSAHTQTITYNRGCSRHHRCRQ
ncbi:hypothetical protein ERO13_D12G236850v2 [Gossypium hirsutum]|uniref:Uncharacterized protein n=2 Tax=Gossypium TaxID=3633 RepID=A0A5D2SJ84_GOSMU|nr:hypothetical protein ERO13_D12G236850v2 [Gossypium hirsutum]TYG42677.1 hypothetical protein ES288_D12G276400v1 [Gossypium darwinii]TYI52716.1 hypothetical protein E1A91_D12G267700v1 [Gossypium mustelinum]